MTMVASSRGTCLALCAAMPKQPLLENRVRVLERKVTKLEDLPARIDAAFARFSREIDAKLEERFRSEVEMMDERFAEFNSRIDERFQKVDERFQKVDQRFVTIDQRFMTIDQRFVTIDQRFDALDKDMKILREGMKILLERSSRSGM